VKVRIGYGLGTAGGHDLPGLIDALERHGFDSLWLSEQITGGAVDPLIGLAYAAGRTEKLKFGTSVLVVPGRNPALLAKELASLDVLSNGRLLPAFGLGAPNPVEHHAFGVDRKERSAWFEEAMPLIRRLWTEDAVDHDGPRFHFEGLTIRPKPVQSPPDVWLGGRAPGELRRVGRLSDGWLPSFCTPEDVAEGRVIVEQAAAEAGRQIDPEHFGALISYARTGVPERLARLVESRRPGTDPESIVPIGLAALRRRLEEFVDVGFSKFVLVPIEPKPTWDEELGEAADTVLDLQRTPAAA
jgi:probable F420-dependent oxidoreductase